MVFSVSVAPYYCKSQGAMGSILIVIQRGTYSVVLIISLSLVEIPHVVKVLFEKYSRLKKVEAGLVLSSYEPVFITVGSRSASDFFLCYYINSVLVKRCCY